MTHVEVGYRGAKPMEIKKTKPASDATESSFSMKGAADFIGDIKTEVTRINWTSWEELKVYTQIVVAATFLSGIGLYIVDLAIQNVLNILSGLARLIGG